MQQMLDHVDGLQRRHDIADLSLGRLAVVHRCRATKRQGCALYGSIGCSGRFNRSACFILLFISLSNENALLPRVITFGKQQGAVNSYRIPIQCVLALRSVIITRGVSRIVESPLGGLA